jgi:hypothetical protein
MFRLLCFIASIKDFSSKSDHWIFDVCRPPVEGGQFLVEEGVPGCTDNDRELSVLRGWSSVRGSEEWEEEARSIIGSWEAIRKTFKKNIYKNNLWMTTIISIISKDHIMKANAVVARHFYFIKNCFMGFKDRNKNKAFIFLFFNNRYNLKI